MYNVAINRKEEGKMSPKKGQKITDSPKGTTIRARVDDETLEKLDYLVKIQNSNRSKVIRNGIEIQYNSAKEKE